ncbi:hypothetical protein MHH33_12745 [Paenisporosarcina sp. FSL H8-0542]|uniref:hypothetical protein n=1 Tax=Paenisporosarcina sp. FSL H8-0542 TaxID=2921401 RepID=UPI003159E857
MKYISGGYYIVSPSERADYMDKTLLPETILSASVCLCDFQPDINILWGGSQKKKQTYSKELNLSNSAFEELEGWVQKKFEDGTFKFPQLFTTVDLAREFKKTFLNHINDIRIIGIGLEENFAEEFLDEEETLSKPAKERYGIETLLMNKTTMDMEVTKKNGYEVLGFESGQFHSYICNGLEKDYNNNFKFSLNENGFIPNREMAIKCCEYSNDEELETESVLWLPWAIFEYVL